MRARVINIMQKCENENEDIPTYYIVIYIDTAIKSARLHKFCMVIKQIIYYFVIYFFLKFTFFASCGAIVYMCRTKQISFFNNIVDF